MHKTYCSRWCTCVMLELNMATCPTLPFSSWQKKYDYLDSIISFYYITAFLLTTVTVAWKHFRLKKDYIYLYTAGLCGTAFAWLNFIELQ